MNRKSIIQPGHASFLTPLRHYTAEINLLVILIAATDDSRPTILHNPSASVIPHVCFKLLKLYVDIYLQLANPDRNMHFTLTAAIPCDSKTKIKSLNALVADTA